MIGFGEVEPDNRFAVGGLVYIFKFKGTEFGASAHGFVAQSQELVAALIASRQVIEAKHDAYTDRLNDERLANMTPEAAAEFVQEMEGFQSTVTKYERRAVIGLMYGGAQKDNDLAWLLFEKFEAHRKLMRYEQRAFNQLRKKSQLKK